MMTDKSDPMGEAGAPSPELLEALLTCVEIASLSGKINKALLRLGFEQELIKAGRGVPDARVQLDSLQETVVIENCSNCGGTHYGSLKCPLLPEEQERVAQQAAAWKAAAVPDAPLEPPRDDLDERINLLPRVTHDGLDYINLSAVLLLVRRAAVPAALRAPRGEGTRYGGSCGTTPFYLYPDQSEPEYDQGHWVIVWYDDLYDMARRAAADVASRLHNPTKTDL